MSATTESAPKPSATETPARRSQATCDRRILFTWRPEDATNDLRFTTRQQAQQTSKGESK